MVDLPRLVLAGVAEQEPTATALALMAALRARGAHVQHFRAVAAFTPVDHVTGLTGIAGRHLDSWIMSPPLCQELFVRSARAADLSVIEGAMRTEEAASAAEGPHDAREVARILDAPVIAVLRWDAREGARRAALPAGVDGVLIEEYPSREAYQGEKQAIESGAGVPVFGGLAMRDHAPGWSQSIAQGRRVTGAMLQEMVAGLLEVSDIDALLDLARSRPLVSGDIPAQLPHNAGRSVRVAVAYDNCFHCYFPDTLDALGLLGAEICEFSPLGDERLPDGTDIVYLGCGFPQKYMQELSDNECMRAAIRGHVCSGRRVYAEGGAAAYLCQQITLPRGRTAPMVGIFPADAQFRGKPAAHPQALELECEQATWIAGRGDRVRGYSSEAWQLVPRCGFTPWFAGDVSNPRGVVRHHCVGSTVHLNFAAQPRVLESFFAPHSLSLSALRPSG
jgi:cobyrinic acid a,c-diamide synthase